MNPALKKMFSGGGPKLALLAVSLIWGTTFPLGKYVIAHMPVFTYLGIRFFMASGLFLLANYKEIRKTTRADAKIACIIGLFLFGAFAFQTVGLEYTTAAKTSFVTGLYVVFVPFLYFLIFRERLTWTAVAAGLLAGVGVAFLGGDFSGLLEWDVGVTLVTISGVFTALQIVGIARYAQSVNPVILAFFQVLMVAVFCSLIAVATETWSGVSDPIIWLTIVFLAVFATVVAYFVQCRVQQSIDHTSTAVILSMECVFGGLLSWMFLDEPFTWLMGVGGILLVSAMIIAQWEEKS